MKDRKKYNCYRKPEFDKPVYTIFEFNKTIRRMATRSGQNLRIKNRVVFCLQCNKAESRRLTSLKQ